MYVGLGTRNSVALKSTGDRPGLGKGFIVVADSAVVRPEIELAID
jgi:hypothetical protein